MTYSIQNWKILSYVQIAFFVIVAIFDLYAIYCLVNVRRNRGAHFEPGVKNIFKFYCIYFSLFVVFKIAGGICATILFHGKTFPLGLTIATFVFDSVSLGFLLKSILPMIEYFVDKRSDIIHGVDGLIGGTKDGADYERPPKNKYHPIRLLTLLLLAAVICSIVASSEMSSDPTIYRILLKVSSMLFLVSVIFITGFIFFIISFFSKSSYPYANLVLQQSYILLAMCPFFFVRVVYSVLAAFSNSNILNGDPSKYTLLFGDYIYYAFLGFVEECIIAILIIISTFYFIKNVNYLHA